MSLIRNFSLVLLVCAVGIMAQGRTYDKLNTAKLGKNGDAKLIDATWGGDEKDGPENAQLSALTDRVALKLKNARMQAGAANGQVNAQHNTDKVAAVQSSSGVRAQGAGESAVATGANGRAQAAQGDNKVASALQKQGDKVLGGRGQAGAHNAIMKNADDRVNLAADGQYTANGLANGNTFSADTADNTDAASRGRYGLKSNSLTDEQGAGTVMTKNSKGAGTYNYKLDASNPDNSQAELQQAGATSGVFARRTQGWKCNAVKDGESLCMDNNGKVVGKVHTNARGEATVVNEQGVVMGRGHVVKVSDEVYKVVVSDGLALAQTNAIRQEDCFADVAPGATPPTEKVVIENVVAKGEKIVNADGTESFAWPSCFDIEGDVTIPEGVDPARIALEYVGHVMPMGSLACQDTMTCGRACYYCNACQKEKLIDADSQLTVATEDMCDLHNGGGRKQKISMKVCPPEELEKQAFCGGFDRQILGNDYYKYNSTINAQVRVWLRPENEVALRTKFFDQVQTTLGKYALLNLYKAEAVFDGEFREPTNNELLEWYVRKNGEEKLMACERGLIDFSVGGTNVNSNLLIDAFANAKDGVQIFSDAPCQSWIDQQNKEYAAYQKEYAASQPSGGSLLSRFTGRGRK